MKILLCCVCLISSASIVVGVSVTSIGGNQKVVIDNSISLPCEYSPRAGDTRIEWNFKSSTTQGAIVFQGSLTDQYKDVFVFDNPSLRLPTARRQDTGVYTCIVTNPTEVPNQDSVSYNVTVLVPPTKPQCEFPSDYRLTIGFSAEFKCSSDGVPAPTYNWYKNGKKLPVNREADSMYKNTSYSYSQITGVMKFSKVTEADAGDYYCEASNELASEKCDAVKIQTKGQDVGMIVGIVFAVIFGLLLIALLVWWTWKKGYCEGIMSKGDDGVSVEDEGSNDIILDGNGPLVHKPPSEFNGSTGKQEASMMI